MPGSEGQVSGMVGYSSGQLLRGKCELVDVFHSCDLSVSKKMSLRRRKSIPDQLVSCRYGYKVICDL